jgi:hypothetical protein
MKSLRHKSGLRFMILLRVKRYLTKSDAHVSKLYGNTVSKSSYHNHISAQEYQHLRSILQSH